MALKHSLLIELEQETEKTQRMLASLTDEHWAYKPHPKSATLGELASHIVELHNWVAGALTKDSFDFHMDYTPSTATSIAELKTVLVEGYDDNKRSIEESSEEDWQREWTLKAGETVIAKMPRAGAIRFIINSHLIHHRGQLTVYLRLLDLPVPGLYGPSADEK